MKTSLRVSIVLVVASEVPDDQRFVTASGQEHIGAMFPSH